MPQIFSKFEYLYSVDRYASSLYFDLFNNYPSRAVCHNTTKTFFSKIDELLNLTVFLEDYGHGPQSIKDDSKIFFIDKDRQLLIIKLPQIEGNIYVIYYSDFTKTEIIEELIRLAKIYKTS